PAHAPCPVAPPGGGAQAIAPLPVAALPIAAELVSWLLRLGLVTVGDLARLPRASLAARLAGAAPLVLDLVAGRDATPLVPFEPPRVLVESASFDDGVDKTEALAFVLRGMASRLSTRLSARGEACSRLEVRLQLDRSIAALRGVAAEVELAVDLPAPLAAESDLVRALRARLERVDLAAPAVSVALVVPAIARARRVQLDLSRGSGIDPDALPALLAELSAEIGKDRVGVLAVRDAHAPERQAALVAPELARDVAYAPPAEAHAFAPVTRLLPEPIPLGDFGGARVVAVDQALYAVEPRRFVLRLDDVAWWTARPISRDYLTAWLVSGDERRGRHAQAGVGASARPAVAGEALVYVERRSGQGFLQGWLE
ncbi:MAG TPA: DNA polymerase Y family protein, partial [Minicystis sp.]|nr:DNA polymerase Y family protein [Minicystis sp.]